MNRCFGSLALALSLSMPALAVKGPEINLVDNKLSVSAEAISLGRLLRLFDLATGMKSKVPPELANRNISVKFSDLNVLDGVKKMFQGQPLDYVVVEGQGVIVTAASQNITAAESVPVYNSPQQPLQQPQPEQPFVQDFQGQQVPGFANPQQQPQPPTIQTPFGPVANPRAPQQAQPVAPPLPGQQQNSLFPQTAQPVQQQQQPPVLQPTTPNPFGTPSPFGSQNQPANNPNNLFGTPPIYTPGAQQR